MSSTPAEDGPCVLVVDNDPGVNSLLVGLLADEGLRCVGAFDGETAWNRLSLGDVAVLVTDLDMPHVDGRELLDRLRDLDPSPAVIVISGYVDAAIEAELLRHPQVRRVLHKPFDLMDFAAAVRSAVAAWPPAKKGGKLA